MRYTILPGTDLKVSEISFGAWAAGGWMWGGSDRQAAVQAILAGFAEGVTTIDTAPAYGQGLSEEICGEAIRHIGRDSVQILTKYGLKWDGPKGQFYFHSQNADGQPLDIYKYAGKQSIIDECEASLKRLGTDYIDLYQIHWADPTTPIDESMEAVHQLIQAGKVRYAGVCNYTAAQMAEAERTLPIVSNQVPYSMLRRDIEQEVVPYCLTHNKGILAYSPLERGLLTGKIKPGHAFAPGDHRAKVYFFSPENLHRTQDFFSQLTQLVHEKGASLNQVVLRWTLSQPGISVALVGARNAHQAIENARASDVHLTSEEMEVIQKHLANLHLVK